ncbi:MAG: hypothetical protein LBV12_09045 [Puniceicoccales bacterium]|jgi:hypothetical protein|nr:hypothetical protein [Puniceicoccales bacterium]
MKSLGSLWSGVIMALLFSIPLEAAGWREMLKEQISLQTTAPDLSKQYPGLAPEMAQLGEAFVCAAYPDALDLGRRNFLTMVHGLGMESPKPADLRQFLHPNKKPWDGYAGPTDGNFHMLLNSGSLSLDTSDGCSKDHPVFSLRRKYSVSAGRVKPIMQALTKFIRSEKTDTAKTADDPALREVFLKSFRAQWDKEFPKNKLTEKEVSFAGDMIRYMA